MFAVGGALKVASFGVKPQAVYPMCWCWQVQNLGSDRAEEYLQAVQILLDQGDGKTQCHLKKMQRREIVIDKLILIIII